MVRFLKGTALVGGILFTLGSYAEKTINIGLNYPQTGPYAKEGLDQWRAVQIATQEINASGGILGKKIKIIRTDSKSKPDISAKNAEKLIKKDKVKMIFGGSSSGVAAAVSKVAKANKVLFFGTQTSSTGITGKGGHKYVFRACTENFMSARVLTDYLNKNHKGQKYFYITADYNWGHSTEETFRKWTGTLDVKKHKRVRTPFPGATENDFKKAIQLAKLVKPEVIIFSLFGKDLETAMRLGTLKGLKKTSQFVVPIVTQNMAMGAGAKVFEGVVGQASWAWQVAYKYNIPEAKKYVETYHKKFKQIPDWAGASAYTILHQYKDAVERAKSFKSKKVVEALEGHKFNLLKGEQYWRKWDHQNIQTAYAVRGKPASAVKSGRFGKDYFEVIHALDGDRAAIPKRDWESDRQKAGQPTFLEW